MRTREPSESRFQQGLKNKAFNQSTKFLRQITPKRKLYYFSEEKKFWRQVHFNWQCAQGTVVNLYHLQVTCCSYPIPLAALALKVAHHIFSTISGDDPVRRSLVQLLGSDKL